MTIALESKASIQQPTTRDLEIGQSSSNDSVLSESSLSSAPAPRLDTHFNFASTRSPAGAGPEGGNAAGPGRCSGILSKPAISVGTVLLTAGAAATGAVSSYVGGLVLDEIEGNESTGEEIELSIMESAIGSAIIGAAAGLALMVAHGGVKSHLAADAVSSAGGGSLGALVLEHLAKRDDTDAITAWKRPLVGTGVIFGGLILLGATAKALSVLKNKAATSIQTARENRRQQQNIREAIRAESHSE